MGKTDTKTTLHDTDGVIAKHLERESRHGPAADHLQGKKKGTRRKSGHYSSGKWKSDARMKAVSINQLKQTWASIFKSYSRWNTLFPAPPERHPLDEAGYIQHRDATCTEK